mmetsp:Transcript_5852/g.12729  ORF Transcript_5852/g.12729 Transcript_5852/m.12729 type:complete len:389 (-) Transcript_5852:187-1353(-)
MGISLVKHGQLVVRAPRCQHGSRAIGPGDGQDSGLVVGGTHNLKRRLPQAAPSNSAVVPAQGQELGVWAEGNRSDRVGCFTRGLPDLLLAQGNRGTVDSKYPHHLHPVVLLDRRGLRGWGRVGLLTLAIGHGDLSFGKHCCEPLAVAGPGQGVRDEVPLGGVHRADLLHRLTLTSPGGVDDYHPTASQPNSQVVRRPSAKGQRQDGKRKSSGYKKRCGGSGVQPQGLPLPSKSEQIEGGGHYSNRPLALLLMHHLESLHLPDGNATLLCSQAQELTIGGEGHAERLSRYRHLQNFLERHVGGLSQGLHVAHTARPISAASRLPRGRGRLRCNQRRCRLTGARSTGRPWLHGDLKQLGLQNFEVRQEMLLYLSSFCCSLRGRLQGGDRQ